jgi:hypothetical protein
MTWKPGFKVCFQMGQFVPLHLGGRSAQDLLVDNKLYTVGLYKSNPS